MWTQFWDMHSGGGQKLDWPQIYIEAPLSEAKLIFQNAFGRNPDRVTCTCCGEDYSISESPTLEAASAYQRNCRYDTATKGYVEEGDHSYVEEGDHRRSAYIPLADYVKSEACKVIPASEIKPDWRQGSLRREGYTWEGDE